MIENSKTHEDIFSGINNARRLYEKGDFREAYAIISDVIPDVGMIPPVGLHGETWQKGYAAIHQLAGNVCGELDKPQVQHGTAVSGHMLKAKCLI